MEADAFLLKLAGRFGNNAPLCAKLRPLVLRILESTPPSRQRTALLGLVVEIYAQHLRIYKTVTRLQNRLNRRLNAVYGEILGIQPP